MKYSEESIQKLSDIEHVRKRPTMYVGDTTKETIMIPVVLNDKLDMKFHSVSLGYLTCVREIIDNGLDVIRHTGVGDKIKINFDGKSFVISDNSVGVPIGKHNGSNEAVPEVVFGHLRSGKNFDSENLIIGMNGMGASITNFLSRKFSCTIHRDGKRYFQTWENGEPVFVQLKAAKHMPTGTEIAFELDESFFDNYIPTTEEISDFVSLIARLNTDIKFYFNNDKIFTNSLRDYKRTENDVHYKSKTVEMLIIPWHTDSENYQIITSVNGVPTFYGGVHENEFETMFLERVKKALKLKGDNVHRNHILKGCCIFVSLSNVTDILFDSQAKTRLITNNINRYMADVDNGINKFIRQEKDSWLAWINDQFERKKTVKRIQKKRDSSLTEYHHAFEFENSEVYIVEGGSAKSDFLSVRNPNQGILPIRGKIMNVKERRLSDVVKSDTVVNIIDMLNININGRSDCPYDKIIIATDADPDGLHIQSLLINFFQFVCPDLMDRVFILQSPLYVVEGTKDYYRTYYDKASYLAADNSGKDVRYNKGLGALTKREWRVMVNPEERRIIKLDVSDKSTMKLTIERVFGVDSDVRKRWLSSDLPIYKV